MRDAEDYQQLGSANLLLSWILTLSLIGRCLPLGRCPYFILCLVCLASSPVVHCGWCYRWTGGTPLSPHSCADNLIFVLETTGHWWYIPWFSKPIRRRVWRSLPSSFCAAWPYRAPLSKYTFPMACCCVWFHVRALTDWWRRCRQLLFSLFSFGVRRKFATFAPRLIDDTYTIQS